MTIYFNNRKKQKKAFLLGAASGLLVAFAIVAAPRFYQEKVNHLRESEHQLDTGWLAQGDERKPIKAIFSVSVPKDTPNIIKIKLIHGYYDNVQFLDRSGNYFASDVKSIAEVTMDTTTAGFKKTEGLICPETLEIQSSERGARFYTLDYNWLAVEKRNYQYENVALCVDQATKITSAVIAKMKELGGSETSSVSSWEQSGE